jgi:arylsulfatase A-like enzyme
LPRRAFRTAAARSRTATWPDAPVRAGVRSPPLDGRSLLRVLESGDELFERPLFWRTKHRSQRAYRQGDWKYFRVDGHEYLFNIVADARERANLASREPQRMAQMRQEWESWNDTMAPIPPEATVKLAYGVGDMPQR